MKIFSSGLQRTGTMSLTKALNQLHLRAIQFPNELYQDIHHPIINEYDAFTDFPIPLLYKELDKAYPGSKFIHTIRDEENWLNSVRWLFSTGSVKFHVEENSDAQLFHKAFYGTTFFEEEHFLARYREYNQETADYFADRPDDFLVIDITAGEGFEKLCPFLNLPIPDAPFPFTNKSEGAGKVWFTQLKNKMVRKTRGLLGHSRLRPIFQTGKGMIAPIPLTSLPERLSCRPFFIISSGRSGSTLLRAILNAHSTVCIPPESHRLGKIVNHFRRNFRFQSWDNLAALVAAEFQKERGFAFWEMELVGFFNHTKGLPKPDQSLAKMIDFFYNQYRLLHKPGANRWGDKSIGSVYFLAELEALFPTAQFIHILRDGRDVAASLFKQGLFPHPAAAAERWLESVKKAGEFGRRLPDGRYLEIRYEALIQEPEDTIYSICSFLDLDFEPAMLEFWRQVDRLGDANRPLHENLKNPINPSAIGKWKEQLNPSQQARLEGILAPTLKELGYHPG